MIFLEKIFFPPKQGFCKSKEFLKFGNISKFAEERKVYFFEKKPFLFLKGMFKKVVGGRWWRVAWLDYIVESIQFKMDDVSVVKWWNNGLFVV